MKVTSGLLAIALAIADISSAQNLTEVTDEIDAAIAATLPNYNSSSIIALEDQLANLEHFWSYGRSPPVYPSPVGQGKGSWAEAYAKAQALVGNMTNEEKNNVTYGYTSTTNGCSGNSGAVNRLGFPGLCLNDAENGVRGTEGVNAYAAAVHVGAAWDKNLAYNRGEYMGAEFKAKGVNVALGPVVAPLGRMVKSGRNFEGFATDPYLAGSLASETIRGMQQNVIACIKHLVGYEQETNRNPSTDGFNASVSSNLDDKTMHELYLWPFAEAVHAGVGSVMCSYNRINNTYACQNSAVMNGLLKTELGFEGFVVSDWFAQHTGLASAEAGLDMAMPDSEYWQGNLSIAVANGSLAQSRLDDMATRIVATWYNLAEFENPGFGVPFDLAAPHTFTNGRDPASRSTIFQGAVEGHVLVKNVNHALPLKNPQFLNLFGYDAYAPLALTASQNEGLWAYGYESAQTLNLTTVLEIFDDPSLVQDNTLPPSAYNGTLWNGAGSGANNPGYVNSPYDAFQAQAQEDGTWLAWDFLSQNPVVNEGSDACIVFINQLSAEGWDRNVLSDEYSDVLVQNVASQCNNTIVVIHNTGVRIIDAWIDNPNITAVIYAHLPGQDSGKALVEVMYGKQSPSGRLPYTVAKQASDYGSLLNPTVPDNTSEYYTQSNFTEGVYIDYKAFIAQNITPRFEFGYGLTYTTFNYSSLQTQLLSNVSTAYTAPNSTIRPGGLTTLWDVIATVDCAITNTGNVTAAEVAQLYVGIPGAPPKQLRGFSKQGIDPSKSLNFHFDLTRKDLSTWDVTSQQWVLQRGSYPIYVGKSVLDIQLTGSLTIQS